MEKIIKASLDRIEGDNAVIYSNEGTQKFDVPVDMVQGAKAGSRLRLYIVKGQVHHIEVDQNETNDAKERIHRKYDRLRKSKASP